MTTCPIDWTEPDPALPHTHHQCAFRTTGPHTRHECACGLTTTERNPR